MKKFIIAFCVVLLVFGILLISGVLQPVLFPLLEKIIGHYPGARVQGLLNLSGLILLLFTIIYPVVFSLLPKSRTQIQKSCDKSSLRIRSWFKTKFGKWFEFGDLPQKPLQFIYIDIIIIGLLIIFSIAFVLAQLQTDYPFVKLTTDGAVIISAHLAKIHPEYFTGDPFLGDPSNFAFYYSVLLPIVQRLVNFTGNYSLAMILVLGPTVFLFLLSFFLLGRSFFKSRWWGLFFTILSAIPMIVLIENLGLMNDPLPRFVFSALIPFVLLMAWSWKDKPNLWIIPVVCIGLMVYIHPVSAPPWAAAIWIGYLFLLPKEWLFRRKAMVMIGLALALIVLITPYAVHFIRNRRFGSVENFDLVMLVFTRFMNPGYLNTSLTFIEFFKMMTRLALLPLSILGITLMWLVNDRHKSVRMILSWCLGIFIVAFLIPFTERIAESIFHLSPLEIELIRGFKHFVLIFILLSVYFCSELARRIKKKVLRCVPVLLAAVTLLLVFGARADYTVNFNPLFLCLKSGKTNCGEVSDFDEVLIAIREQTPEGAGIFFSRDAYDTDSMAVRYLAYHPLMYSWKDKNLIYAKPGLLDEWYSTYARLTEEGNTTEWYLRDANGFMEFVKNLGTSYIVLEKPKTKENLKIDPNDIVFQNVSYVLFSVGDSTSSSH